MATASSLPPQANLLRKTVGAGKNPSAFSGFEHMARMVIPVPKCPDPEDSSFQDLWGNQWCQWHKFELQAQRCPFSLFLSAKLQN